MFPAVVRFLLCCTLCLTCGKAIAQEPATEAAPTIVPTDDVSELTKKVRESLVVITFSGRNGKQEGLGSGFVISADGLIATNMHVLGEARPIQVKLPSGKSFPVEQIHASDRHLDLAILKIDATDLKPLALGDSAKVEQGQSAIALGNPRGYQFSVVAGVISGRREIDGKEMLQLGMPIEQGNSGGPVLDREGNVLGIVTLKSLVRQGVAFAVPIDALKPLLADPNPIPMSRWLTIGVLDAKEWTTLFGANWKQRAGRISVSGLGSGFGGRSLALSSQTVPKVPYEVQVTVKLDDEAGAAGLVFGSDGADRHFGFYPSAGGVRLTRFDGPDVFSWNVIEQTTTPLYREENWNTLKVRIEENRIRCFVNDQPVIEAKGETLFGDTAGLAKFRDTVASFRGFAIGSDLPPTRPSPEVVKQLTEQIDSLKLEEPPGRDVAEKMSSQPHAKFVLRERARQLEVEATRLRQLADDVHTQSVLKQIETLFAEPDDKLDLLHAGLLIAQLDNADLEIESYLEELNRMANEIRESIPDDATESQRLAALDEYLFEQLGYHGSRHDYYNASNSYLNEVIDDREGLPITLSVLYLELASRLDVPIVGVGLPSHFIVRYEPSDGEHQLIDPFHKGKRLSREDAESLVLNNTGRPLADEHLATVSKRAIAERMINNLFGIARDKQDVEPMRRYASALAIIVTDDDRYLWYRAVLNYQTSRTADALLDIETLLAKPSLTIDRAPIQELKQVLVSD